MARQMRYGPYRVVECLSEGGMGTVFRGVEEGTASHEEFAIKVIPRAADGSGLRDLVLWRRELEALSAVNHPSIVRLRDFGETRDSFYLVLEFVAGRNLKEVLADGALPPAQAVRIALQVAGALRYAHARNLIHLDLKPHNIVLEEGGQGTIKVLDFGLSRYLLDGTPQVEGAVSGTMGYMSPEQFAGEQSRIGPHSDLYSVGIILYEMLAGKSPFEGMLPNWRDSAETVVKRLYERAARPPRVVRPVLDRLLQSSPDARYQSAAGLLYDLEQVLERIERGTSDSLIPVGTRDHRHLTGRSGSLVGRAGEEALLSDLFGEVRQGSRRTVFVAGSAGIGKSRLMNEFATACRVDGATVLLGKATRNTRNVPYYPVLAAVSDFLDRVAIAGVEGEVREGVHARLREAFDLLRGPSSAGGGKAQVDLEQGKERFLRLLTARFAASSSQAHPLVLILDDLQWADHATIDLVERLISGTHQVPMFIAALYRDDESDPYQRLGRMLASTFEYSEQIQLRPLTDEESGVLAAEFLGAAPADVPDFGGFLGQHAAGNPFSVLTLCGALVEEGVLRRLPDGWHLDRPALDSFVEAGKQGRLVEALVSSLDGRTVDMLEWAAVVGHQFDRHLLGALVDAGPEQLLPQLQSSAVRGILEEEGDGRFRFTHDQYRDVLYERLPGPERKRRHQRTAEYIEQMSDGTDPRTMLDLAEHFSRGTDVEKALEYALVAADISVKSYAFKSAQRYAKAALLMVRASTRHEEQKATCSRLAYGLLGDALGAIGDYEMAVNQFERALNLVDNDEDRADLLGRKAAVHVMKGELETAAHQMEEALALLGVRLPVRRAGTFGSIIGSAVKLTFSRDLNHGRAGTPGPPDPRLAMCIAILYRLVFTYFFLNMEKSLAAQLVGMHLTHKAPLSAEVVQMRAVHAPIICGIPMPARAVRAAREAIQLGESLDDALVLMHAVFYAGCSHYFMGRWEEAVAYFRQVVSLFDRAGDVFMLAMAHENLGFISYDRGEFGTAISHFERALQLAVEVGDFRGQAVSRLSLARCLVARGELSDADEQVGDAVAAASHVADHAVESAVRRTEAVVQYALGNRGRAEASLDRAVRLVEEHKLLGEYVGPAYTRGVEMLLGSDRWWNERSDRGRSALLRKAASWVRGARGFAHRYPAHQGTALRALGLLQWRRGRIRKAHRSFARAARALKDQGQRYELALTYYVWAHTMDEGDPGRSGALGLARGLLQDVGAAEAWRCGLDKCYSTPADLPPLPAGGAPSPRRHQERTLQSLVEVGKALSSTLEVEPLLDLIMDSIMEVAGADKGRLLMDADARSGLKVALARGGDPAAGEDESSSQSIIDMVLRTGEPVLFSDAMMDPRLMSSKSVYRRRMRSVLCFPLTVRDRTRGVIYLENNRASNLFAEEHLELVRIFAAQASIALENGLAYRKIEELNRELEVKVRERTTELSAARDELAAKNRELSRTVRELKDTRDNMIQQAKMATLGELAAGATHEINNPLNFMRAGAFALDKRLDACLAALPDEMRAGVATQVSGMRELTGIMVNGCERIGGIVEGLWRLVEQRDTPHSRVSMHEVVQNCVALARLGAPDRVAFVEDLQSVPDVLGHAGELSQVLLNLLSNALDAVGEEGTVTVRTCTYGDKVRIEVEDDGLGIDDATLPRIFEPFVSSKRLARGRGLGLAIALQIAQQHDGTIRVASEAGVGSLFTVDLPTAQHGQERG